MPWSPPLRSAPVWIALLAFLAFGVSGWVGAQRSRQLREGMRLGRIMEKEVRKERRAKDEATFRSSLLADHRFSVDDQGNVVATADVLSKQLRDYAAMQFNADDKELQQARDEMFSRPIVLHSSGFTFTVTRSSAGLRTVVTSSWLTPEVIAELRQARR